LFPKSVPEEALEPLIAVPVVCAKEGCGERNTAKLKRVLKNVVRYAAIDPPRQMLSLYYKLLI
jgi:hypothetical protein